MFRKFYVNSTIFYAYSKVQSVAAVSSMGRSLGYYLKTPVPLFKGPFSLELGIAQFPWGSVPELGYAQFPLVGGEVSLLPGVRSTPVSLGYYVPQCPYGALFKGPYGTPVFSIPSQGSIVFLTGGKATVGLKQGPSALAAAVKNI